MMSQTDMDKLIRQTRQYEFSDGLRDLQLAVLFAVGGMTVWLSLEPVWMSFIVTMVNKLGRWAVWLGMLPALLMPLAVLGMLGLMNHLRRRWLWRESGEVKPSRFAVPRGVNVLAAVIFVGGLAVSLWLRFTGRAGDVLVLRMLWAATGWSFGYTLVGVGRHIGFSHYVGLGTAGGLLSTALLVLPLTFGQSALVFGIVWSLILAVSGVAGLRRAVSASKRDQ